ncbi:MAG: flagellar filament capping protein FliD [Syntrophorhabdaceae bacterium]|nr:flagellar filament capping protein FliD [Syntrophorhabdaceae bacterium]
MATFSVGGIMSGIDYDTMIQQIIKLEHRPLDLKADRQKVFQTKISSYGELSSLLGKFKSAADGLKTGTDFYARKAEAGNKDVINVSASPSAAEGNYSVVVNKLAQAHRIASSGVADGNTVIASGAGSFAFKVGGGEEVSVDVNETTTLNDLAAAINSKTGSGVEASVINDGTNSRLVLKSASTGSTSEITITENGTNLFSGGQTLQEAQDAEFSIDGLSMTRSSNNIEGAISGVSITLKNVGSSTISVTNDSEAIQKKIQSFVDAYNDVVKFVSKNVSYDSKTGVSGAFTGESTARDVVNKLRGILGTQVGGLSESLSSLSQIGVSTQRDGTLKLDTTVLAGKIASDIDGVSKIFSGENGIAGAVGKYVDEATNSSGVLSFRTKSLQSIVTRLSDEIERGEANLKKREENLILQFAKLEGMMTQYSSLGSSLASMLAMPTS